MFAWSPTITEHTHRHCHNTTHNSSSPHIGRLSMNKWTLSNISSIDHIEHFVWDIESNWKKSRFYTCTNAAHCPLHKQLQQRRTVRLSSSIHHLQPPTPIATRCIHPPAATRNEFVIHIQHSARRSLFTNNSIITTAEPPDNDWPAWHFQHVDDNFRKPSLEIAFIRSQSIFSVLLIGREHAIGESCYRAATTFRLCFFLSAFCAVVECWWRSVNRNSIRHYLD